MTQNFPGPYEVRLFYSCDCSPGDVLTHQMRFSCSLDGTPSVGDDPSTISVNLRGGGTDTLDNVIDALTDVVEDLLSAADSTLDYAELWHYPSLSFEATYITTYDISLTGQDAGAPRAAAENIYVFRTTNGGIMKAVLLDHVGNFYVPTSYADLTADNLAFVDFLLDAADAPFVARDGGWPVALIKLYSGQNEHVFKRRYGRLT